MKKLLNMEALPNKEQVLSILYLMNETDRAEIYKELSKNLFSKSNVKIADNSREIGLLDGNVFFREKGDGKITTTEFLGL